MSTDKPTITFPMLPQSALDTSQLKFTDDFIKRQMRQIQRSLDDMFIAETLAKLSNTLKDGKHPAYHTVRRLVLDAQVVGGTVGCNCVESEMRDLERSLPDFKDARVKYTEIREDGNHMYPAVTIPIVYGDGKTANHSANYCPFCGTAYPAVGHGAGTRP